MSLQIRYNRVTTLAGVQPDTITARMGVSFTMAAEEGSVGMSEIVVDDTTSVLDYVGLRRVYAYETTAPAHNQMIFNGYLQGRTVTRRSEGQDSDEPVTALDRRWTLTASDSNSLMSRRLITGSDGNRPAETDIARIQWLLDSNDKYLSNPRDTWTNPSPYIDTAGPISMDAADLRGQTAFDVMNDCAQRSGKNWFARYYETNDTVPPTNGGSMALWYAFDYGTSDTSTLRLTNIKADIDNIVTFAVHPDMVLTRDPTRTYSGVYLTYDGGTTYQQSTNVSNLFQQRDAAVNNPNIKTAAKATALATRYLADAATEEDRINCRFVVAKQYVNLLREGQRFQGKFSHLPGYASDYNYMRCLRRTVTQINDEFYEIAIEASPIPCTPSISRSGVTTIDVSNNHQFGFTATAGSLLMFIWTARNNGPLTTVSGWTRLASSYDGGGAYFPPTNVFTKVADGTETSYNSGSSLSNQQGYIIEVSCGCSTTMTDNRNDQTSALNDCNTLFHQYGASTTTTGAALILGIFMNGVDTGGGCPVGWHSITGWDTFYEEFGDFWPNTALVSKTVTAGTYQPEINSEESLTGTGYKGITITIYSTCT